MKHSNFGLDLVGGLIPPSAHTGQPVKTNNFYREAFIHNINECSDIHPDVRRQMGLRQLYRDESYNRILVGDKAISKKRSLHSLLPSKSHSNTKSLTPSSYLELQSNMFTYSKGIQSASKNAQTSMNRMSSQIQRSSEYNSMQQPQSDVDQMKQLFRQASDKALFAKLSSQNFQKQSFQYSNNSSIRKANNNIFSTHVQPSLAPSIDKPSQERKFSGWKLTSRSLPSSSAGNEGNRQLQGLCKTAGQSIRPGRQLKNIQDLAQQEVNTKEKDSLKEELLRRELEDEMLNDGEDDQIVWRGEETLSGKGDQEELEQEARILLGMHAISSGMYKKLDKVKMSKGMLERQEKQGGTSKQKNDQFSNKQTMQNSVKESINNQMKKELLSYFNENRYKYFSNKDLNAEKFFVTRNRERIKDLNFERVGIFKSKIASTHVKNFRFFINDIKLQEPRFQEPLRTEHNNISMEQHQRKSIQIPLNQIEAIAKLRVVSNSVSLMAASPSIFSKEEIDSQSQSFKHEKDDPKHINLNIQLGQNSPSKYNAQNLLTIPKDDEIGFNSPAASPQIQNLKIQYKEFIKKGIKEDRNESLIDEETFKAKMKPNKQKKQSNLDKGKLQGNEHQSPRNEKEGSLPPIEIKFQESGDQSLMRQVIEKNARDSLPNKDKQRIEIINLSENEEQTSRNQDQNIYKNQEDYSDEEEDDEEVGTPLELEKKLMENGQQDSVDMDSESYLEKEQKRLEEIENLFFLKLNSDEAAFYNSEDFKIERKKVLLDTILKNKKITQADKKLIFANLIYQYDKASKLHSRYWCKQMTEFLLNNKFKYNLDEAANRKYERAHGKLVYLPTFREPEQEFLHSFQQYIAQSIPLDSISLDDEESINHVRKIYEEDEEDEEEDLEKKRIDGKQQEKNQLGLLKRFVPRMLSDPTLKTRIFISSQKEAQGKR